MLDNLTLDGDRVEMPERLLWLAVLGDALALALRERDTSSLGSALRDVEDAQYWIGSPDFREVCHLAGVQPDWVERIVAAELALPVKARHLERFGLRNLSSHKDFVRRGALPARARGRYAA